MCVCIAYIEVRSCISIALQHRARKASISQHSCMCVQLHTRNITENANEQNRKHDSWQTPSQQTPSTVHTQCVGTGSKPRRTTVACRVHTTSRCRDWHRRKLSVPSTSTVRHTNSGMQRYSPKPPPQRRSDHGKAPRSMRQHTTMCLQGHRRKRAQSEQGPCCSKVTAPEHWASDPDESHDIPGPKPKNSHSIPAKYPKMGSTKS